jgi:hypothetical protein
MMQVKAASETEGKKKRSGQADTLTGEHEWQTDRSNTSQPFQLHPHDIGP